MYLSWIDYGILILLLVFSLIIGIYHGCMGSKPKSTKEFLVADGRMNIIPTAMSLLAGFTSAIALLGTPVEIYYYGTMYIYCIISWFIATYITMKIFIPKFHYIGSFSIYAYLEKRFSLTIRILVTSSYILVTILYMGVMLYAPSLALSQMTGLNLWIAAGTCGIICTIYTSIGGMKAVIWTDVIQASMMFIALILSIIIGLIDIGGTSKLFEILKNGNRLQLTVFNFDPRIRYTIWSILIGATFSSTAQYSCIQTQAQRYMCVKDIKSAKRVAWITYIMNVIMYMLCVFIGCLLYAKYHQCDPLHAKLISRSDQMYPLFITETLGRFPGFPGLFIAALLSATLSTFSSGVNSIATVIMEDIYKQLTSKQSVSTQRQLIASKILSVIIGCLTIFLTFIVSYTKSNIITLILQIYGTLSGPIFGVYLLGLFSSRVKSRSVIVAFILCLVFQTFMLIGSMITIRSTNNQGGRLPTSVNGCVPSINITLPSITKQSSNVLTSLFSISPLWLNFNGTMITIIAALIGTFIFDSKDSKIIDRSLLVSIKDIFPCFSTKPKIINQSVRNNGIEDEPMI